MKLPRDVSGPELVKALRKHGYEPTRRKGSSIRVTTMRGGEHHETVPDHHPLKQGTLSSILKDIARHHQLTMEQLLNALEL